jgi:hypothetical protein
MMLDSARMWTVGLLIGLLLVPATSTAQELTQMAPTAGRFTPSGPPLEPPTKVDSGESCVIDLIQPYTITGSLSGSLQADYRILVAGACGAPMGTFDEQWIAHGTFTGTHDGASASGRFTYTATVKAGGDVEGRLVFGQGMRGTLRIRGNFGDGYLSYEGHVE